MMSELVELSKNKKVFVDLRGFDRIRQHSPDYINYGIENKIVDNVVEYGAKDTNAISQRINTLEREWDIDRTVMGFFSVLGGFLVYKGLTSKNRKWFYPLALQIPFLGLHALRGWCPPVSLLRRLGFRTNHEINAEKYALKTLRGDFHLNH